MEKNVASVNGKTNITYKTKPGNTNRKYNTGRVLK